MFKTFTRYIPLAIALIMAVLCGCVFTLYMYPMEDVSLDLSLSPGEDGAVLNPDEFDSKGWMVFVQEGQARTELIPNGFGGYSGLELGQTFYMSRVMDEELDSPTLQIDPTEWNFSVWLDEDLIYTDCPSMDNRIGCLRLPVNDWYRDTPITISLPVDYYGKTLTIAQSTWEWMETGSVMAWPTSVRLYCGYAYESGLISETFRVSLVSMMALLLTMVLLSVFVRYRDWSILCLAVVAFYWLWQLLSGTSFFYKYALTDTSTLGSFPPLAAALALLSFLTLRSGSRRKFVWVAVGAFALSILVHFAVYVSNPAPLIWGSAIAFLVDYAPYWLASIALVVLVVLGAIRWRKENWYYKVFMPLSLVGVTLCWTAEIVSKEQLVWDQIVANLASGQVLYLFSHTIPGIAVAALITAVAEGIRTEFEHRAERHLVEQRNELTMASYENLRRQHEEVMMLRHDMLRHFHTLHDMDDDGRRTAYLAELIGQNQKIRPVVQSGNEMMDIILNGKLGAAVDAGIRVEIPHINAPASLPLSDPDLCGLIMNIVDNAIKAASAAAEPYILLKIHERDGFLGVVCENSFVPQTLKQEAKKETVPKHGLGLKIVKGIVAKYSGVITEKNDGSLFVVKIVIPL